MTGIEDLPGSSETRRSIARSCGEILSGLGMLIALVGSLWTGILSLYQGTHVSPTERPPFLLVAVVAFLGVLFLTRRK